jgi:sugar fermentation stimulation protein A
MPNYMVKEWLMTKPQQFEDVITIKQEYTYGNSRFDFYMENQTGKILMEVKGVTLERDGIGYFPDAPTERGVKHINELIRAKKEGYAAYLAFVIQMNGIKEVRPNIDTHPEFGKALDEALQEGVKILFLSCNITKEEIKINLCMEKKS